MCRNFVEISVIAVSQNVSQNFFCVNGYMTKTFGG